MLDYKPYSSRSVSNHYKGLLRKIIYCGEEVYPQQEEEARMVFGYQMRFSLNNGFPVITERDLASSEAGKISQFHMAIAELSAFLNGARTQDELKEFGCGWWRRWVTREKCGKRGLAPGDLGPGSYGPAWRSFPAESGASFDQIKAVIEQIRELPHLRTHFVSPWIPQYVYRGKGKTQKVVVVPCHGWFHVHINTHTGMLSLHHIQRSADVPVGLVFNLIQYAALTMMIAQVTGYAPKELVFTVSDAHIFKKQLDDVYDMLKTESRPFPTVIMDSSVDDLFAFRPHHFTVQDYEPQLPRRVIWTPI